MSWDQECMQEFLKFAISRNKVKNSSPIVQYEALSNVLGKKINGLEYFSFSNDQLLQFAQDPKIYLILSKITNEISTAYKNKIILDINESKNNNDEMKIEDMIKNVLNSHYFQLFGEIRKQLELKHENKCDITSLEKDVHCFLHEIFISCEHEMNFLKKKFSFDIGQLFYCEVTADIEFFDNIVKQIIQHKHKNVVENIAINVFSTISTKKEYSTWMFLTNLKYGKYNDCELLTFISECCNVCMKIIFFHEENFSIENYVKNFIKNQTNNLNNDEMRPVDLEKLALHNNNINNTCKQNNTQNNNDDFNIRSIRKSDLQEILKSFGLYTGGTKSELIDRLKKYSK